MVNDYPFDVFLYYSIPDLTTVSALAEQLRDDGLRVWFDEWQIATGDDRTAKIAAGLAQARVLILCLSTHMVEVDWTQMEQITLPFRNPLNLEQRFLLLHLDDSALPATLTHFLPIDWSENTWAKPYANLLDACRASIHPPRSHNVQQTLEAKVRSFGHTEDIESVMWSPDGQHVLSGSADSIIRVWEVTSGRCIGVLQGHTAGVFSVAWSPDGQHILSGSADKTVRVWDVASGHCLLLEGHTDEVLSVAWSPGGQHVLSGSADKTLRVWNVASGHCLSILEGHMDRVWGVAWSPGGQHVLSGSADKTLRVWNVTNGRCVRELEGHMDTVFSVAWSLDGQHVLSGSTDKTLRVWDVTNGRCVRELEGHMDSVVSVAWNPKGQHALSGSADKTMRVWDVVSGCCLSILEGHTNSVFSVAWSPDRQHALSGSTDKTVRVWDVASGHCVNVLEGHTDKVLGVAWSPDGQQALSGSEDNMVRVWDVVSGHCLSILEGHTGSVNGTAWSPDGKHVLSGSEDETVRIWDVASSSCVGDFKGHTNSVVSVAWSPDGKHVLSGSEDKTVRVWDVASGRCVSVFKGHTNVVVSVAWSPDGQQLLSGSTDRTVRVWDVASGRCISVLEGHTNSVFAVAWSPNGQYILSGSTDKAVRVWDVTSGRCVSVLEGHTNFISPWSIAWSLDGMAVFSAAMNGVMRIWELESETQNKNTLSDRLIAKGDEAQTKGRYTNAKVLLVGDTGVGKSTLAARLVAGRFVYTESSHARRVKVLDAQVVTAPDGFPRRQEIVLWDLAGQPAYRLVHQLSLENAAVACVLFDNRHETNPFAGPSYWSQALDQGRGRHPLCKILVATRTDVGGLPASRERIESFMHEHGFSHFIATSASTGEGCNELRSAIRQAIAWDELPWLSTTQTMGTLRIYVAKLKTALSPKEDRRHVQYPLFSIAALHEGFAAYSGEKLPLADFIAHLQRLEATDALDLLVFHTLSAQPQPEDLVLLDPTRVDAYASALLIAARDEPDGPGHLLEKRIRQGDFKLEDSERLGDQVAERHVLWFVIENLLGRDLALREQIQGEDYLVFPSQCTAELTFPGAATFGVAYSFAGPVRNIYATLIAQLAHFEGFQSREFFHDAAAYRAEQGGGRCLVRLHDTSRGQGEIEVSFEPTVPSAVRQGFLEFISKHLKAKSNPNSVISRHAYHCQFCSHAFEDRVVKTRLDNKKRNLLCPICEKKTQLYDLLVEPNAAAVAVAQRIDRNAKDGRQRMTAANYIKFKEDKGIYDIFLSHNSKDKAEVEQIAKQLKTKGIRPWLDKWDLVPGDTLMDALERAIKSIPCAALCFGPADVGKWHIMEIRAYLEKWAGGDARLIPLILPGVDKTPDLPLFVRQTLWVDMRRWQREQDDGFYRLVCGILGRAPGDAPLRKFGVRNIAEWQGLDF